MTSSRKIVAACAVGFIALGTVFWMRSLASWRPVKIGQADPDDVVQFLSSDGQTALTATEGPFTNEILHLESGQIKGWPDENNIIRNFSLQAPELAFIFKDEEQPHQLDVREVQTGQLKRIFRWPPGKGIPSLVQSRESASVSIVLGATLWKWSIQSGLVLEKVALKNPFPTTKDSAAIYALSPDSKQLLGCSGQQGKIWQLPSGTLTGSWTTKAYAYPCFFSPDAHAVFYSFASSTDVQSYSIVDARTGKTQWKIDDEFGLARDELFLLQKERCQVLSVLTGRVKRNLPGPRQSDGKILRVTSDYIYTLNSKGEIFRWRSN